MEYDFIYACIARKNYSIVKILGEGKYGVVYLVNNLKYNYEMAIKVEILDPEAQKAHPEVEKLMKLSHPNIIKVYDYWTEDKFCFIVMKYCVNGSLQQYIEQKGPVEEAQLKTWYKQLLDAISFCHEHKIVHRDIKPANLLIDEYYRIQLVDFGLSQEVENGIKSVGIVGTPVTMAPEIFKKEPYDPIKSDIWSLGVTFYWMAFGSPPYDINSIRNIKTYLLNTPIVYPCGIDNNLKKFLQSMLQEKPENRLTALELLQQVYLVDHLPTIQFCKTNREGLLNIQRIKSLKLRTSYPKSMSSATSAQVFQRRLRKTTLWN